MYIAKLLLSSKVNAVWLVYHMHAKLKFCVRIIRVIYTHFVCACRLRGYSPATVSRRNWSEMSIWGIIRDARFSILISEQCLGLFIDLWPLETYLRAALLSLHMPTTVCGSPDNSTDFSKEDIKTVCEKLEHKKKYDLTNKTENLIKNHL